MKIFLIVIAIMVSFYIYRNSTKGMKDITISKETETIVGNVSDIERNISRLMNSDYENAFLIIYIFGTEDFLQFTGDAQGVQMDFPLITARQKSIEKRFRNIAKIQSLKIDDNQGSDGSGFLDIELNGEASDISIKIQKFMLELYQINEETKRNFELEI